jgi:A/G-specific adenine glycosylase
MPLSANLFQKKLLSWFDDNGRKHLPWQQNKTPYRVWISEIMLQQTQVATVIPYFERFMKSFPNIKTLANAHEDEVLHHWAGLGYYSRARNLHRAAKMVMNDYHGAFPDTAENLLTLPGIGESTCGAILSIAYNQRAPILDGNVKRVLSRMYGIQTPLKEKETLAALWEIATRNTPLKRVADYTQAIMDLGATLCTRSKPQCSRCPFKKSCYAFANDMTAALPMQSATKKIPTKSATFLLLDYKESILLLKRPAPGIWGGLYSLPQIEATPTSKQMTAICRDQFGIKPNAFTKLPAFKHTFSHYHLMLNPIHIKLKTKPQALPTQIWYNPSNAESIGLPKPIKTLLKDFYDTHRFLHKAQKRSARV